MDIYIYIHDYYLPVPCCPLPLLFCHPLSFTRCLCFVSAFAVSVYACGDRPVLVLPVPSTYTLLSLVSVPMSVLHVVYLFQVRSCNTQPETRNSHSQRFYCGWTQKTKKKKPNTQTNTRIESKVARSLDFGPVSPGKLPEPVTGTYVSSKRW